MKKHGKLVKVFVLMLAAVLLFSLAACGQSNEPAGTTATAGTDGTTTAAATEAAKEPLTLRLLSKQTAIDDWNNNHEKSPVQQEIKRLTGITLEQQTADDNQFNVILASGDLPDLIRCDATRPTEGIALIEGGHLVPMDELFQTNGQGILESIPETLAYSKANWSAGKNQTFFIPANVGPDQIALAASTSPAIRWDYYKELGCPPIKTQDDLLNVLAEMVKRHPTTEDGKKVYGVSMWNDWGNWTYNMTGYYFTGIASTTAEGAYLSVEPDSSIINGLAADGHIWNAIKFFYNAKKMGILDPDCFTMKYADYEAKGTAGQLLYAPADWPFVKFNQQYASEKKGYMSIPIEGMYQYQGNISYMGYGGKHFAITTDCKTPERAMDLLNFLWSYDGCRTMYSGVEGKQWNMVDGKPVLTDETIAAFKRKDADWIATNINYDYNNIGLSPFVIHPRDGEPLCLFNTAQVYSKDLNPLMKDFSDFYGVPYPGEIFNKMLEEGKMKDRRNIDVFAQAMPDNRSDELNRINGNLKDLVAKQAAKCILAKSDEEFEALKEQSIKEFEKAGLAQNVEAKHKWYEDAKQAAKQYYKE